MDRTELHKNSDSLRSDPFEIALEQPQPVLDQLAKQVDTSKDIKEAEAVISKVLEAAESNQTIERMLERKHEVKDTAVPKDSQGQRASSLREVLSNKEVPQPTSSLLSANENGKRSSEGAVHKLLHDTSLYAYAIRYGLVSGLLTLIIAIVVAVLFT